MILHANYGRIWSLIARRVPDRVAVIVDDLEITYAEFDERATRFASVLAERGIGHGSPVAVVMYNRVEYMVALFATLKLGATIVPVNFRYGAREVSGLLTDARAEVVVFPSSLESVIADAVPRVGHPMVLVRVDDRSGGSADAPVLDAIGFDDWPAGPSRVGSDLPEGGELYLFTGGTTGYPKGVVWPVDALLNTQLFPTYTSVGLAVPDSVEAMIDVACDPDVETPVVLPLAPFMHGTALFNSMNAFLRGGTLVILSSPHFDAFRAVAVLRDRSVSRVIVAGDSVAIPLLEAAEELDVSLPLVRSIISSGMRFSDAVKARLHALGSIVISDVLAATEGGPFAVATSACIDDLPARLRLLPDAVVFDELRREVQDMPGAVGLLAVRGTLPTGYLDDGEKNAATYPIIDGVRHLISGDYVRVGDGRHVELLGRGSSVINTGGEKVYPAEVEEVLLTHPAVSDAVVFGLPDDRWGETVSAVVAAPSGSVVDVELIEHVGRSLAGYKKPKRILVRPTIERSPSGKVDMERLRRAMLQSSRTVGWSRA